VTDPDTAIDPDAAVDDGPTSVDEQASIDPEAPAPPARTRPAWLLPLAASLVLAALLVGAVVVAVQRQQLADERDDRREIERVSGELATALLTYDADHLDASRDRVLARATGKFRKEYEAAFDGGLRTLITETKASSQGTVTDIFVSDIEDDAASAIVVANAVANGTGGRRASLGSYIQLDLVQVGGRWRVDGVTNLTFNGGGATTPTTAGN
jgi:Mce-associated membrane protein